MRRICLVDSCEEICCAFRSLCPSDFKLFIFDEVGDCLNKIFGMFYDLLIVDVTRLEINGDDYLAAIRQKRRLLPIIGIGPSIDTPSLVRLMKKGLSDFVEKPLNYSSFFTKVQEYIDSKDRFNPLAQFTPREKEVYYHILNGKTNKEIANLMQKSIRTIEDHRANLMKKVRASNLVELIKFGIDYPHYL